MVNKYEYAPEEPEGVDSHCEAADIALNILLKMESESLQNLVNKVTKLEKVYEENISKGPGLSTEEWKPFMDREPEERRKILLAAIILHGIAFTQLKKATYNAARAARWLTSRTAEEFISNKD